MDRYLHILLISTLLLQIPAWTAAVNPPERYRVESWGLAEGLPQNSVLCIRQQGHRELWIGTRGGLVRFDGVHFSVYNKWTVESLTQNHITALAPVPDGSIWIGTAGGGICRHHAGSWRAWHQSDGLASEYINSLLLDSGARLWIGTALGLNVLVNDRITRVTGIEDHGVSCLLGEPGKIWVGCQDGWLFALNPSDYRIIEGYHIDGGSVHDLTVGRQGRLWIGTDRGLYLLEDAPRIYPDFSGPVVKILHRDHRGRLWIGTEGEGIYVMEGDVLEEMSPDEKLSRSFITSIQHDHEGNIWIGTYTGGLVRLAPAVIEILADNHEELRTVIFAVESGPGGALYAGTINKELYRITGERAELLPDLSGFGIRSLLLRSNGELWIGTDRQGVITDGMGDRRSITTRHGITSNQITCLVEDSKQRIWLGSREGLSLLSGGALEVIDPRLRVNTIHPGSEGGVMVGTESGLYLYRDNRLQDLSDEMDLQGIPVLALFEDTGNQRWFVATNGKGLLVTDPEGIHRFTGEEGLPGEIIYGMVRGPGDYLWFSSLQGIFRIHLSEFEKEDILDAVYLNEEDGMENRECTSRVYPAVIRDSREHIYFSTLSGIAFVDTRTLSLNRKPPEVAVTQVVTGGGVRSAESGVRLAPGTRMVELHFSAFSYAAPRKVRFRYQLAGWDDSWQTTPTGLSRSVIFGNLDPGRYTFRITAGNNHQFWNPEVATFGFSIRRYFFQTRLFYLVLLVLCAVGLAFVIRKRRMADHRKKKKKYSTATLNPEVEQKMVPRLEKIISEEKIFLNPNLTLQDLAGKLYIHRNYLSQIINAKYGMNFKDFLNRYRIEEAKRHLLSPEYDHKTVLAVVYDSGFNSKSVFNNAFKKFTGMTPTAFRKKHGKS